MSGLEEEKRVKVMRSRRENRFLLSYTLMFAAVMLVTLGCFRIAGKSLLWFRDGIGEHAPALIYLGQWLRDGLSGGGWKMVDLSIAQGLDVLTTLTWFCFTDPASMVSVFFQPEQIELTYGVVMFLRIYLSGVFAALLARQFDADGWQASLAGILYAFSCYTFLGAIKHLNFGPGMMYLPLLFYAIERVIREKRWGLYVVVAALQMIANFYFAYKNTILAIVYIIVRLIVELRSEKTVRRCAQDGTRLFFGYALGLMMSAVVLLPMLMAFLDNTRTEAAAGYQGSMLHFSEGYYKALLLQQFQLPRSVSYWAVVGAIPLCAFGVLAMYVSGGRKYAPLRVMPPVLLAMLCVPLVGKVLNGMGYVINRWTYALQLFIAVGACVGFGELEKMRSGRRWLVGAGCALYLAAAVLLGSVRKIVLLLFLVSGALLIVLPSFRWKRLNGRAVRVLISLLTTGSLCVYAYATLDPMGDNYLVQFNDRGLTAYEEVNPMGVFTGTEEDEFFRVAGTDSLTTDETGHINGIAPVLGYHGVGYYWSIIPSAVTDFYTETYQNSEIYTYCVKDLGLDLSSNLLANVRYMLRDADSNDVRMYGYSETGDFEAREGYEVLENAFALPLGYTFDDYMPASEWAQLPVMEKRDALLSTAVVDDSTMAVTLPEHEAPTNVVRLPAKLSAEAGEDGRVALTDGLTVSCEVPGEGEIWIVLEAPDGDFAGTESVTIFPISGELGDSNMVIVNHKSNFIYDQQGQVVPMGVYPEGETSFVFAIDEATLPRADLYSDSVEVYYRPVEIYEERAAALKADVLENVEIGTNRIAGTIALDQPKWLQVSVPYSKGWTAVVDGEEAKVLRSGGMYMGVELDAGEHEVVLNYRTPYLREGALISLAGLLIFLGTSLTVRLRGRKKTAK